MTEIIPPYDFPPRQDSIGEQIERIVGMIRDWLRQNPEWVPFILRWIK